MKTSDFYYDLPEELIAQDPLEDRASSRLLVLNKKTGEIEHTIFKNIKNHLKKGDCLVINNTKVIPARLIGEKEGSGGKVEFLLLKKISLDTWEIIVKPGKKARGGARVSFGGGLLTAEVIEVLPDGNRIVKFFYDGVFENVLDKLGQMPLPPYITHALKDKNRYQTVYAKNDGSAAAPTAGLHFTKELLTEIKEMGVYIAELTLHVGLGTFRPVKVDDVESHVMHSEYYKIDEENAEIINNAKKNGGRIISVGTTSTRVLETVADENGHMTAKSGETKIFIYPPYKYKIVDALITNFHLPESTLLMLVSALAGKENIARAYKQAVEMKYRFFSFGDAMFIE
ncbi:tRNA preQ1(34) S-adenosylmethionine ribosyltransferase-isomerase QueA [Qingrenia yutianensis]|uniref:S-adenosylmethionine:tRNA ribosyltransferase-isomerase n=1 Tax=Qingrenia yutianensis TaxID=2763676 RepID=A0A926FEA9_9FIRM|nr:tRNA preQ1(34) S-adenosylmethionine ribosyltransferase-isomerase QueA [Qingrenia yutianensis]MBC8596680.1 tRNA preQ1(34) S-adenosylmethionine ribosyltransferase-isomerase QueA [Qingrenia yutianensis]